MFSNSIKRKTQLGSEFQCNLRVCLIEFKDSNSAVAAAEFLNNYKLDPKHTLTSYTKAQADHINSLPEAFEEPIIIPQNELLDWIADTKFRDQICILSGLEANVYWFSHLERELILQSRIEIDAPATKFEWSPNGMLLAIFNTDYIQLFGGDEMKRCGKFHHEKLSKLIFSPDEQFMITFNDAPENLQNCLMKNEVIN